MTTPVSDDDMRALCEKAAPEPWMYDTKYVESLAFNAAARSWIPNALERLEAYKQAALDRVENVYRTRPNPAKIYTSEGLNCDRAMWGETPRCGDRGRGPLMQSKKTIVMALKESHELFIKQESQQALVVYSVGTPFTDPVVYISIEEVDQDTIPLPCVCGEGAYIDGMGECWVECEAGGCWYGPTKSTEQEAVAAWNALMGKK